MTVFVFHVDFEFVFKYCEMRVRYMTWMFLNDYGASFLGQVVFMRPAVASGVSVAGTLALAQRLLFEPRAPLDWPAVCPSPDSDFNWASFCAGLICGLAIFALVEAFVTIKWAVVSLVSDHLASRGAGAERPRLYRF